MKIESFIWNDTNIEHIAGHSVDPDEVEEVFQSRYYILLRSRSGRYLALGRTITGRYLTVVFEFQSPSGTIRVITARSMDNKEKKFYKSKRGIKK